MIDFHAHMAPEASIEIALRSGFMPFQQKVSPALFDIELQQAQMASQGIRTRYLSVPPLLYGYELEDQVTHVRRLNDWLVEVTDRPDFRATCILPFTETADSVSEARRIADLGVRSIAIGSHIHGRPVDTLPDDFWSVAEELFDFVMLHPWLPQTIGLLGHPSLLNPIGNPIETTIAAARLISAGVLERHPRLTVLLVHGGGTLPYILGRMRKSWATRQEVDPINLVRRFLFDTVVFEPAQLRLLVDAVGADRIVLGTDSPFAMSIEDPRTLTELSGWDPTQAKHPVNQQA